MGRAIANARDILKFACFPAPRRAAAFAVAGETPEGAPRPHPVAGAFNIFGKFFTQRRIVFTGAQDAVSRGVCGGFSSIGRGARGTKKLRFEELEKIL